MPRPAVRTGAPTPLLPDRELDLLRSALLDFRVDTVHELLGPAGRVALSRGDHAGVARALRTRGAAAERLTTLIRLFVLGRPVPVSAAATALRPLDLRAAWAGGLLAVSADDARALVDIRPYAELVSGVGPDPTDPGWLVVSDLGADVRTGPLPADHVLGIGQASLTLAQATPRPVVDSALDIGTGCGVQALHLSRHAGTVVATDVSRRALRLAATTAALSGQRWELRTGSLLEPVATEQFDLIVANPPFVVSPGATADRTDDDRRGDLHDYRDSGLPGDEICARLVRGVTDRLTPTGSAHLLANWVLPSGCDWADRVGSWLDGAGCDAWVWQREVADPATYVDLWLRDAGHNPTDPSWGRRYDAWLDWFGAQDIAAVGMGLISLWRTEGNPTIVLEDVPQLLEQPIGAEIAAWHSRARWLRDTDDATLLASHLQAAPDLVLDQAHTSSDAGWTPTDSGLRLTGGMRWSIPADDAITALVGGCDGSRPLAAPVAVLAATLHRSADEVRAAVVPTVRDLVQRGVLIP